MEKKINKLVVPLTIKSMSLLGAMTIMATSIGGCASKKKNKEEETKTTIVTTSDEEIKTKSNIEITTTTIPSETTVQTTTETINDNEVTTTKNTTTKKTNQTKPKTTTKKTQVTTTTTTQSSKDSNSVIEDLTNFTPLTSQNINDMHVFDSAVYKMTLEITERKNMATIFGYYYKDQKCQSSIDGFDECKVILAMANQKYLNTFDYEYIFKDKTLEDLQKNIYLLKRFNVSHINNKKITWSLFMLDKTLANYIEDMQNETYNQIVNNSSNFEQKFKQFYYEKNGQFVYGQNALLDAIITNYAISVYENNPSNSIYTDAFYANRDAFVELENEISNIYEKMNSNAKVLTK